MTSQPFHPNTDSALDFEHASPRNDVSRDANCYVLLNDQPVGNLDNDFLEVGEIAKGIASTLMASRESSPFVLAVDAGWGMGKSTLLTQIEGHLPKVSHIVKVRFNAWTAESGNALEGLIKSVLFELDDNIVRRKVRALLKRRRLLSAARLGAGILGRFLGVSPAVDEIWEYFRVDSKSRNELRHAIHEMLAEWTGKEGRGASARSLVVFVDDLDRCSDEVVVKVCEAVKLYLDAPGLIFVIACDQSVLARGVAGQARGTASEGRSYLEKIVQVSYHLPLPGDAQIKRLIQGYANRSGTSHLIDDVVTDILATRTNRNPRRIKRIINSFVLEYQLDADWHKPPLGSIQLVTAIILQQLYTPFYDLIRSSTDTDPISEFFDYVEVRRRALSPTFDDQEWWSKACDVFRTYSLPEPSRDDRWQSDFERLERSVPEVFAAMATDDSFISFLQAIGDAESRAAFRGQLIRRPPATGDPLLDSERDPIAGWRIVCVDDNPDSVRGLVEMLQRNGALPSVYSNSAEANLEIRAKPPHAVVSDITRGDDPDAGFDHVERLRASGYTGPVVFFTSRITEERRRRASDLNALDVVASETEVVQALRQAAYASPGLPTASATPPPWRQQA